MLDNRCAVQCCTDPYVSHALIDLLDANTSPPKQTFTRTGQRFRAMRLCWGREVNIWCSVEQAAPVFVRRTENSSTRVRCDYGDRAWLQKVSPDLIDVSVVGAVVGDLVDTAPHSIAEGIMNNGAPPAVRTSPGLEITTKDHAQRPEFDPQCDGCVVLEVPRHASQALTLPRNEQWSQRTKGAPHTCIRRAHGSDERMRSVEQRSVRHGENRFPLADAQMVKDLTQFVDARARISQRAADFQGAPEFICSEGNRTNELRLRRVFQDSSCSCGVIVVPVGKDYGAYGGPRCDVQKLQVLECNRSLRRRVQAGIDNHPPAITEVDDDALPHARAKERDFKFVVRWWARVATVRL